MLRKDKERQGKGSGIGKFDIKRGGQVRPFSEGNFWAEVGGM